MNPAIGPFAIAAALLVLGGTLKALQPSDTARALRALGLPGGETAVRIGGAAEACLGVAALVAVDAAIAGLVAASYAAFGAFVMTALVRRLPIASCGCFGKADAQPTYVHVGVSAGACVAAVGMAIDPTTSPLELGTGQPPGSIAFVVLVAVGVLASFAVLTLLPRIAVPMSTLSGTPEAPWR